MEVLRLGQAPEQTNTAETALTRNGADYQMPVYGGQNRGSPKKGSKEKMFDDAFFDEKIKRIAEAVVELLPGPKVAQRYLVSSKLESTWV